jgi:hypothetical protein
MEKSLLAFAHDLSSSRFHITPINEIVVELLLNGGVDIKHPRCIFDNVLQVVFVRWGIATGSLSDKVVGICIRQASSKELCFADLVSITILRHVFESCKCLILEVLRKRGSKQGLFGIKCCEGSREGAPNKAL